MEEDTAEAEKMKGVVKARGAIVDGSKVREEMEDLRLWC